jgi:dynein intermediate chain 2
MEITTVYQKERHEFGRPVNTFAHSDVFILDEFLPDSETRASHIERNPTILDVQAIPELSETYVNTERFSYVSQGMLHLEGGWPKDVDSTEKDQTLRYKKKVEKDEEYIRQVRSLGDQVETDIKQNYAIDIYQEYFSGEYADHSSEPPSAKTLSVFKDPCETKRSVSSISWHPDGSKLATAFSIMQFQDSRMDKVEEYSYLWDVNNPNTPEMQLKPASPLCCLEYNPKDPHFLVGGSYNGLVSCFDTRTGENPKDQSIIETSHRDPVYKCAWLAGKHPFDCCSTSTDGQVLWWDVRKLSDPLEGMLLIDKASPNQSEVMGGVSMEYTTAGGKFLIGTERGGIVSCSRKGKTPADKVGTIFEGHCGPVYGLHRNIFFPKFFVSVGDWRVNLWNEELKSPIMTSKFSKNYVLDAMWSPTRPGVFVTVKADGVLDVWDIFYKQNDPTLSLQVDTDGLRSLRVQEKGSLLATGSVDGTVYMLELCEGLTVMQPNEKNMVMQMLERESKREKNLEARAKEMRAKEKRAAEAAAGGDVVDGKESWEESVKAIEEKFWETVGGKDAGDDVVKE